MSQDNLDFDALQEGMEPSSDEEEEIMVCEWHGCLALSNYGLAVLNAMLPALMQEGDDEEREIFQELAHEVDEATADLTTYVRETDPADLELELLVEYTESLLYTVQLVVGACLQNWTLLCPDQPLPSPPLVQTPFELVFPADKD